VCGAASSAARPPTAAGRRGDACVYASRRRPRAGKWRRGGGPPRRRPLRRGLRGGSYPFTWYRSAVATTTLIRRRRRSRVVLERNEARHGKQLRRWGGEQRRRARASCHVMWLIQTLSREKEEWELGFAKPIRLLRAVMESSRDSRQKGSRAPGKGRPRPSVGLSPTDRAIADPAGRSTMVALHGRSKRSDYHYLF
jgi:hypothetical protein